MRHRKAKFQLNLSSSLRSATLASLTKNLFIYQSIKTTKTKALAVQPQVDKLITLAKQNTLTAKRRAFTILGDHKLVSFLFGDIGPRFTNRVGGYTRILNLDVRRGDNAKLAILELTEIKKKEKKLPKKEKEVKPEERKKPEITEEQKQGLEEKKPKTEIAVQEKPPITKKPTKKFLEGIRSIFKKGRDAL